MTRCYSGLHFMDLEALDAALAETTHEQVSELEQSKSRLAAFQEHLDACGGDLAKLAESYKTFGLQRDGSEWTYCEWMPYAAAVYLVGDFNGWDTSATPLAQAWPSCSNALLMQSRIMTRVLPQNMPTLGHQKGDGLALQVIIVSSCFTPHTILCYNAHTAVYSFCKCGPRPLGGIAAGYLELQHSDHANRIQVQALRGARGWAIRGVHQIYDRTGIQCSYKLS